MADSDAGKVFVGGISRDTNDATLRDHFSKYGDVSSSIVAVDRLTGLSRGFGFVTFSDPSSLHLALRDHHLIAGRPVEVKKAIPRNEHQSNTQQQQHSHSHTNKETVRKIEDGSSYRASNNDEYTTRAKKIFVGGLSANVTEEEFKNYFEKFGRITDVVVMHDNITNRPRGFGFITFDSEEVVEKLMQKSHHELGGKRVEVKRAVPREATKNNRNGSNSRFDDGGWVRGPTPVVNYPCYYYGGGYPAMGGYGMPVIPMRTPWNGVGVMGVRPFLPYGTGYYPTGVNGGVALLGMVNGYNCQMNGARSDVDNLNSRVKKRVVNGRKNSKVPPVDESS